MKITNWKCVKCGLEVEILKPEEMDLSTAECQDCGLKTLREVGQ